jgi:phage terminase small subunit
MAKKLAGRDRLFALEYLTNGQNATAAYQATHPKAQRSTCRTQGTRALAKPHIAAFLRQQIAEREQRLIMEADEALAGITQHARADIRKLFRGGRLLPIAEWPDDVANSVKALKPGQHGTAIVMYDKLDALKTMAINGGKLRQGVDHTVKFPHLELLGDEPPDGDDE